MEGGAVGGGGGNQKSNFCFPPFSLTKQMILTHIVTRNLSSCADDFQMYVFLPYESQVPENFT